MAGFRRFLCNRPENIYIQSARLNERPLNHCWFEHAELVKGGKLEIEPGPEPNKEWDWAASRRHYPASRASVSASTSAPR
ncbi:MAG TPA: glycoside hydrolase domain-containing protein [Candidatus Binatia bacterium]|jgi:putative alpha-1,2-mannosidase|nr:glycoside hydrolase domain-containing protein [Candidatus Binatia bacterium]